VAQPSVSGRRAFDKTVSSKPLVFVADAAAMGIECCFGTEVRVDVTFLEIRIDPCRGRFLVPGSDRERCRRHFLGARRVQTHVDRE